ncbi:haloacid dehalogenase [Emericellopsis cladophorae]|uniref:Haloacid dehalogenase n=1 Tax=Emericellopsis cladophorae TaxID=2686198 RepID=A0A9Q0BCX9_9HYPO|nr:haloacid dehalogenase [Emericellopsis cladophorae]KAI6780802.1 haloacid dehalogenase [Emericellopsis cladophorae]
MPQTVIAFDLFGTILSTDSIAQKLGEIYGKDDATRIATEARRLQLEYTWRCVSMGTYKPFDQLTRFSFRQAVHQIIGKELSSEHEEAIMDAYNHLSAYPEVDSALSSLSSHPEIDAYIFSNGTQQMLTSALSSWSIFPPEKVISVDIDALKTFKPAPKVYEYVATVTGMQHTPERAWLVSSNPFDVLGAVSNGMRACWVDRTGQGWRDGLSHGLGKEPTLVVRGVDEAVTRIMQAQ